MMIGRIAVAAVLFGLAGADVASAQGRGEWVPCARENGYCRVPYPTVVRFGARGSYAEVQTDRGVRCSNNVFGDPAEGIPKSCFYLAGRGGGGWDGPPPPPPPRQEWGGGGGGGGWQTCAREGGYCDFRGPAMVRYGVNGRWLTLRARDGISCDNDTFGQDPAYGNRKVCQIRR